MLASRATGPTRRARPRASGTTRPRMPLCMASLTGCRPSSGGTSTSSPPRSAIAGATTTNTLWRWMSRATARPGNRRLKTRRRSCPRLCVIWPAGSTVSLRPNTTTLPRTRPSRRGSLSTSILSRKEGGGSGEAHPSKNFPDRMLETYVDLAYIAGRPFRRRPCSVSTIPPARSTSATRPG